MSARTILDWKNSEDSIKLEVVDYQFPNHEFKHDYDYYDCNWLMIRLEQKYENSSWSSKDPCFMTDDLSKISRWLNNVLRRGNKARDLSFMEPNIELYCTQKSGNCFIILVKLAYVFGRNARTILEFKLTKDNIKETINNIKKCLKTFPIRSK